MATSLGAQATPRIQFEKYTLPNGLQVILHEDHSTPIVTVNTWYHVGSGDEQIGRTGFAHLFEHIMFMGSKNVPVEGVSRWDTKRPETPITESPGVVSRKPTAFSR